MGEIKSTLDLVMDKTKHLTLSDEEKEQQKEKEFKKKLKGPAQKFQDQTINKRELKKEINNLLKTYGLKNEAIIIREFLNRLSFNQDNQALLALLNELWSVDITKLEAIFNDYNETIQTEAQKRMEEIKENLAQKRFISGSAVVPNISADDEWIRKFQDIKDKFDQLLGAEKARIAG